MDVSRLTKPRISRVLLCSILYTFASASILAYSIWCINANNLARYARHITGYYVWMEDISVHCSNVYQADMP